MRSPTKVNESSRFEMGNMERTDMEKRNNLQNKIKVFMCIMCLILTGCSTIGLAKDTEFESAYENLPEEEAVDIYTSKSVVVIEDVNEDEGQIIAFMTERNESRTFFYNGACMITDKYGNPMSMAQLSPGDIADFAYNAELERVGRISLTTDSWKQQGVEKYTMAIKSGNVSIGEETYSLSENTKAFSGRESIVLEELLRNDVLTFNGRGNSILSITVDKGHGYLNLVNDENFDGGWIEVGQTVISQIFPDMLITVPEGTYTVRLTASGVEEVREVTIERNKETVLDLEDVEFPKPVSGRVIFDIIPEDAEIYVDEELIDTSRMVKLPYGMHRITAKASGYDTLSEYYEVEGDTTVIKMRLDESSSVSENDIKKGQDDKTEGATITIDVPQAVEVYQDNLYKGIAPVTYEKTPGTHTITLRLAGYITKSYEIQVPDDDMDVTYSFSALDSEDKQDDTVSGNSTSSKSVSDNSVKEDNKDDKKKKDDKKDAGTVSDNSISENSISENAVD